MANENMRTYWNEVAGPEWTSMAEAFDETLAPVLAELLDRARPQPGERALDVGCGFGSTTIAIARAVAPGGYVTGLDISKTMLASARERSKQLGIDNVSWLEADAQVA